MTPNESPKNFDHAILDLSEILSETKALVIDSTSSVRSQIANVLWAVGVKETQVFQAESITSAESLISKTLPKIIIVEYEIGKRNGLELIDNLKLERIEPLCFFFLCNTPNQVAIAKALEEIVDGAVLKPCSPAEMRGIFISSVMSKLSPNDYLKKINEGRLLLNGPELNPSPNNREINGRLLDEVLKIFSDAKSLDPKPSLACYYIGKIFQKKNNPDQAFQSFEEGLTYNKPHFKCYYGIYEVYLELGQTKEAYQALRKVCQYFPMNAERLKELTRMAISIRDYEEIEKYYVQYNSIEKKTEHLTRYICAALLQCGLQYLLKNMRTRALEIFLKAATVAGPRTKILRNIITLVVEAGAAPLAEELLKIFPPETQGTPDFLAVNLLVFDSKGNGPQVVARGRELVSRNIEDPVIYQILIQRSLQSNLQSNAEEYYHKAIKKYPELKEDFDFALAGKGRKLKVFETTWDELG